MLIRKNFRKIETKGKSDGQCLLRESQQKGDGQRLMNEDEQTKK